MFSINEFHFDLSKMIFATGKKDANEFKVHTSELKGWEKVTRTIEAPKTTPHLLEATTFKNDSEQKIAISINGTHFAPTKQGLYDLIDDITLAMHKVPYKYEDVKKFIDHSIREVIDLQPSLKGKQVSDPLVQNYLNKYEFITTGHSLGAVLSDLAAVYIKSLGLNVTQSITFDSPGSRPVLLNALKTQSELKSLTEEKLKNEINFTEYLSYQNVINKTNNHFGKINLAAGDLPTLEAPSFFNKVSSWVSKACNSVKEVVQHGMGHKVSSLIDRFKNGNTIEMEDDWINNPKVKSHVFNKLDPEFIKSLAVNSGQYNISLEQSRVENFGDKHDFHLIPKSVDVDYHSVNCLNKELTYISKLSSCEGLTQSLVDDGYCLLGDTEGGAAAA
jgi:hypothetical protein